MRTAELLKNAKRVLIVGNGGSFANAIHICNDFLLVGVKAMTLDPSTLTASANDFGYETVFERWIETHGEPGAILIALSGSGQSPNIRRALAMAKQKGMTTFGLFGAYNELDEMATADFLSLAGDDMQEAEEAQVAWGHEIMRSLKG